MQCLFWLVALHLISSLGPDPTPRLVPASTASVYLHNSVHPFTIRSIGIQQTRSVVDRPAQGPLSGLILGLGFLPRNLVKTQPTGMQRSLQVQGYKGASFRAFADLRQQR